MKVIKEILFWTWCLPQTLVGLIVKLIYKGFKTEWDLDYSEKYINVYESNPLPGAISLGKYIILGPNNRTNLCIRHEYGHQIQSFILGPLYLLVIGLPSLIWCNLIYGLVNKIRTKKHKGRISYYWFYTEAWANELVGLR